MGQQFVCVGKTDLERFLQATSRCTREVRLAFGFGHKGLRKALLGAETLRFSEESMSSHLGGTESVVLIQKHMRNLKTDKNCKKTSSDRPQKNKAPLAKKQTKIARSDQNVVGKSRIIRKVKIALKTEKRPNHLRKNKNFSNFEKCRLGKTAKTTQPQNSDPRQTEFLEVFWHYLIFVGQIIPCDTDVWRVFGIV